MARVRNILFRIFYSTSFTLVFLLLFAFCCVTPADTLYQSYKRNRVVDICLIAGAYILTGLIALFLYASRLYSNRSVLRDIPKTILPIEKDDLPGKRVYKLIEECLKRSAVIAYQARPRAKRIEVELPHAGERLLVLTNQSKQHHHEHRLTEHEQRLLDPKWGPIAHPGWHSPAAKEMPNLQYAKVVDELIDLIEAKAVSLAPRDPLATPNEDGTAIPDQRVLELLTRPDNVGMRHYLSLLTDLGVVPDNSLTEAFIISYERARFAPKPLSEPEFQALMRLFAELLRSMKHIDQALIDLNDIQDDHSLPHTPSDKASTFSASSIIHPSNLPPRRMSEDSVPSMSDDDFEAATYYTTKSASRSRDNRSTSRPTNPRFFSASSRPNLRQRPSEMSERSARSGGSERSNGSVIRLRRDDDEGDLPYTIEHPGAASA